ncbi:MAG: hypothetical protein IKU22_02490 [Alistipes sp.]|nr:hypothetical protein [Alistipes sp.]
MACKSIISHIQAQAERVIAQHEKIADQVVALTKERDELKVEVRKQQEEIMALKAELQQLRLTQSLSGNSTDKAKSRARINQLLREVDKCIALLTKAQ